MTNQNIDPKPRKHKDHQDSELQHRVEELENDYKRALADYQNLLKQTAKERQDYLKFASADILERFLPILDNLELAYRHLKDSGLDLILKQFKQLLNDEGLLEIKPELEMLFNEHEHECLDTIEGTVEQQNKIAEVIQIGYKYSDGQVLRHAKVKVYQVTEDQKNEDGGGTEETRTEE